MTHKNIHSALAAAQSEMSKALKGAKNPHFRKAYADLGNVMDACLPALNAHGISLTQPVEVGEFGNAVRTILTHGESETSVECAVPLLLGKQDMQGLGSAMTYARRYGLMSMAGIAPEDDDGNAAAASPPAKREDVFDAPAARDRMKAAIAKQTEEAALDHLWKQETFTSIFAKLPEPMQLELTTAYTLRMGEIVAPANEDLGMDELTY